MHHGNKRGVCLAIIALTLATPSLPAQTIYRNFGLGAPQGAYTFKNLGTSAKYYGLFDAGFLSDNIRVQVSITILSEAPDSFSGILFGGGDAAFKDAYAFLVSREYYMIARTGIAGGVLEMRPQKLLNLQASKPNVLRVDVSGAVMRFSINNTEVSVQTASAPVRGFLGLFLNSPQASAKFENLTVERMTELAKQ
jgi:hypothetical protein